MKFSLLFIIVLLISNCTRINETNNQETTSGSADNIGSGKFIADGLYLVTKTDTDPSQLDPLSSNEQAVFFSKLFDEYNAEDFLRIIVETTEYVPIQLGKSPTTEQQTNLKKKLLLI